MKFAIIILTMWIAVLAIWLSGCGFGSKPMSDETILNVHDAYFAEMGRFVLQIDGPKGSYFRQLDVGVCQQAYESECSPLIVYDVPEGNAQWAHAGRTLQDSSRIYYHDLVIHLHPKSKVEGAEWDHGKFGRGKVTRIE